MRITTIMGSPNQDGNTHSTLAALEDILSSKGHTVTRLNASEMKISGCRACFACQGAPAEGGPKCALSDDFDAFLKAAAESDLIVYGSPIHGWSWTAQIKPLLDRQLCLIHGYGTPAQGSHLAGKAALQLLTCMGPVEDNASHLYRPFEKMAALLQCAHLGTFTLEGTIMPNGLEDRRHNLAKEAAKTIEEHFIGRDSRN